MIGSQNFQMYTENFNRIALIELIDNLCIQARRKTVRASLVANPLTNVPYGGFDDQADTGLVQEPMAHSEIS